MAVPTLPRFGGHPAGRTQAREGSVFLRRQGSGLAPRQKQQPRLSLGSSVVETSDGVTVAVRPTAILFRGRTLRPLAKAGFELADRLFGTRSGTAPVTSGTGNAGGPATRTGPHCGRVDQPLETGLQYRTGRRPGPWPLTSSHGDPFS